MTSPTTEISLEESSRLSSEKTLRLSHVSLDINKLSVFSRVDDQLQVVCRDINYVILSDKRRKKQERTILSGLSVVFRPGRLTAIMGASGAGKTTLLNLLAGEISVGQMTGTVQVNGETYSGTHMKDISGFVFQDDVILDTMTVREAIWMSALLRLPKAMANKDRMARMDDIIGILGLEKCQNTIIGSSMAKGISGGEKKRTAIAMEMITNPPIIFFDEPTSGLDTSTAYSVVSTLSNLARQGRTVIATVHQPSSEIFHVFDDLLLLAEGRVMYYGPSDHAVKYFAERGFACPLYTNPADYFFMEILSTTSGSRRRRTLGSPYQAPRGHAERKENANERIRGLLAAWRDSEEFKAMMVEMEHTSGGVPFSALKQPSPFLVQFGYLMGRCWKNLVRNKMMLQVKVLQTIFIAVLIGLIFRDVNSLPVTAQIQNRNGALFFIAINQFFGSSQAVLSVFALEKAVFMREWGAGYYSLSAYYISKTLSELPYNIACPAALVAILYYMIGLQPAFGKFIVAVVITVLSSICGVSLGISAASIFPSLPVAMAAMPLIILPLMLFSGLFVNVGAIPVYFAWIQYISPMRYAFAGLAKNEYNGLTFSHCQGTAAQCSGQIALHQLDFADGFSVSADILMLVMFYVFFTTLGYLALLRLTCKRR